LRWCPVIFHGRRICLRRIISGRQRNQTPTGKKLWMFGEILTQGHEEILHGSPGQVDRDGRRHAGGRETSGGTVHQMRIHQPCRRIQAIVVVKTGWALSGRGERLTESGLGLDSHVMGDSMISSITRRSASRICLHRERSRERHYYIVKRGVSEAKSSLSQREK
jgi:hypothetical protein